MSSAPASNVHRCFSRPRPPGNIGQTPRYDPCSLSLFRPDSGSHSFIAVFSSQKSLWLANAGSDQAEPANEPCRSIPTNPPLQDPNVGDRRDRAGSRMLAKSNLALPILSGRPQPMAAGLVMMLGAPSVCLDCKSHEPERGSVFLDCPDRQVRSGLEGFQASLLPRITARSSLSRPSPAPFGV